MPQYRSPQVFVEEVDSAIRLIRRAATTIPGFLGIAEKGPFHQPVLVTSFNHYKRIFGGYVTGYYLTHAVEAFFKYTNTECYVVRTAHYTDITDQTTLAAVVSTVDFVDQAGAPIATLTVDASSPGTWGDNITITTEDGYDDATNEFNLYVLYNGSVVEVFKNLSMTDADANYVETIINAKSAYIVVTDLDSGSVAPTDRPANAVETALTSGDDGLTLIDPTDFVGSSAGPTGLYVFNAREDISTFAIPGITDQVTHEGLVTFVEQINKFAMAVLDSPFGDTPAELETYVRTTAGFNTKEAGMFYPWIKTQDPVTREPHFIPPSGIVVGIMAKTDVERGVHKAPAGTQDGRVFDALGLEYNLDPAERDVLYDARVNFFLAKRDYGEVLWGNRVLTMDTNWSQLSVRRTYHNIARSLLNGTQNFVFEPNNQDTRNKLRDSVYLFLLQYWREGALYDGGTGEASSAFYVTCDESNNPQSIVDEGKLVAEIGVVITRAAEFVILRISQWDGGRILEEITS